MLPCVSSTDVGYASKSIGLLPVSNPPGFEISPDKLATMDVVLEDIIKQDTVPVALRESIVGQYTHVVLRWRASLTVLYVVYTYIHAVDRSAMMWKSVKQELCMMRVYDHSCTYVSIVIIYLWCLRKMPPGPLVVLATLRMHFA